MAHCYILTLENDFSTSHYHTSILHQDTWGVEPVHVDLIYMGPTFNVSWCMIDVR
jgi:hypothetical protein